MEQFKDSDYQALKELSNSIGWKLLCNELDERIKSIETILLTPTTDDMFGSNEVEILRLNNYKKAERIYLLKLKNLPLELIDTKIKIGNK